MAYSIFLKLAGIAGASTDPNHRDQIEIDDFSWGEQNGTLTGALTASLATAQDIRFVKHMDVASLKLLTACATAQPISQAVISVSGLTGKPFDFLTFTLSPCVVASYHVSAIAVDTAEERFSLAFTQIKVSFTPANPDGTAGKPVAVGYDFGTRKTL